MKIGRFIGILVISTAISLALLLLITGRNLGDMNLAEVQFRWAALVLQGAPAAELARSYFGLHPPAWIMRLALIWHQAKPLTWWWLPLLMMAAIFLVNRAARRRSGR
jgi:hypothetical protein